MVDDITIRCDQTIDLNTRFLTTNNIDVTTQELPGNTGARAMQHIPHEIHKFHRERKILKEGLACDRLQMEREAKPLDEGDKVDYPSDESDEEIANMEVDPDESAWQPIAGEGAQ